MKDLIPTKLNINGYTIFYTHCPKNITSIHTFVNTGSLYESSRLSGIAHLLEHILLDSWLKCKGGYTKYWSQKGIISNAQTMTKITRYYIVGSSAKSEDMYDYIASCMTSPKITEKILARSKHAVKDELLNMLNNPNWKIQDVFYKSILDNTPDKGFGRMADWKIKLKNLDTITLDDLISYYTKWYTPNNMFFTVVTNEGINRVTALFKKYLVSKSTEINSQIPVIFHVLIAQVLFIAKQPRKLPT